MRSRKIILKDKTCPVCKAKYNRKPGETTGHYRNRETCGVECGHALRAQRRVAKTPRPEPKPCECGCGNMMTYPKGGRIRDFERKRPPLG